jgi:hypothetical protein
VLGVTPLRMARVPVGTHELVLRDLASGRTVRQRVEVPSIGVSTPYVVRLP